LDGRLTPYEAVATLMGREPAAELRAANPERIS
jgi:hypothetical protein